MGKFVNIVGMRFGRLVVIRRIDQKRGGSYLRECICDCGNTMLATPDYLKKGRTVSCGCYNRETVIKLSTTHGMSSSKIYAIWNGMVQRCTNQNSKAFNNYGGRGIKVCDRWMLFENFYDDMGDRPEGKTLERVDNDGDYSPENCIWATRKQQANNRRVCILLTYNGVTQNISQWAADLKLNAKMLYSRYKRGWSDKDILTKPSRKK